MLRARFLARMLALVLVLSWPGFLAVSAAQAADGWSGTSIGDPGIPFTSVAPVAAAEYSTQAGHSSTSDQATSATSAGYATSAGTASQLGNLTCPGGYALTLVGGSPMCVNSVANATTAASADSATTAVTATSAGSATSASSANYAENAGYARNAGYASNADTVDGKHASELGSSGGGSLGVIELHAGSEWVAPGSAKYMVLLGLARIGNIEVNKGTSYTWWDGSRVRSEYNRMKSETEDAALRVCQKIGGSRIEFVSAWSTNTINTYKIQGQRAANCFQ